MSNKNKHTLPEEQKFFLTKIEPPWKIQQKRNAKRTTYK